MATKFAKVNSLTFPWSNTSFPWFQPHRFYDDTPFFPEFVRRVLFVMLPQVKILPSGDEYTALRNEYTWKSRQVNSLILERYSPINAFPWFCGNFMPFSLTIFHFFKAACKFPDFSLNSLNSLIWWPPCKCTKCLKLSVISNISSQIILLLESGVLSKRIFHLLTLERARMTYFNTIIKAIFLMSAVLPKTY